MTFFHSTVRKVSKNFFFFLFENSSIFLSPPLLDLCKFYWKFSHALLVSRRLYYKPFRNWEGKNCIATWWMYPMIFAKRSVLFFSNLNFCAKNSSFFYFSFFIYLFIYFFLFFFIGTIIAICFIWKFLALESIQGYR